MPRPVFKLGIIGGGLNSIAGYPHFVASQMDHRFKVESGVFSNEAEENASTADYWGVERWYKTIDEFISAERGKLDAVTILLPTPDHFRAVENLIKLKVPVICEKPLFSTLAEIEKLGMVRDLPSGFLVTTYNYIAYPILSELRDMIAQGRLGRIINIHLEMPQESFLNPPKSVNYPPAWRKKDGPIPSVLLDLLSHLFSISHFIVGKRISKVFAHFNQFSRYKVVDDVKVIVDYADNATGFFWASKIALGNRNGLKFSVYGEKASASWIQEYPERLSFFEADGTMRIIDRTNAPAIAGVKIFNRMTPGHPAGYIEAFARLYYEIANALEIYLSGKDYKVHPLIWSYEKELENFHFLSAVVESASCQQFIEVAR